MKHNKVCVIGADSRMSYVGRRLAEYGFAVSEELALGEDYAFVVISPKPDSELVLRIAHYYNCSKIYGGLLDKDNIAYLKTRGIEYCNYMEFEALVSKNAIYTARGIGSFANEKGAILRESSCLVTGFGYCARAIAGELFSYGARVFILARNKSLQGQIESMGYEYLDFASAWKENAYKFSYVFNTVPALVLDSEALVSLADNVMIFDIASSPGGTDFAYCRDNNIDAYLVPGIPGRYYPKEAGFIIADAIWSDWNM